MSAPQASSQAGGRRATASPGQPPSRSCAAPLPARSITWGLTRIRTCTAAMTTKPATAAFQFLATAPVTAR
jgi:hypothetical protein